ncbi:hypothetical protein COO60DRAFT_520284 [Scenedesmus sp. NREL 46B-D3]|nr:hypothetical protein COO60DRAFT_520284 [Scenedesmus sp. NREL 46B-D3]
MLQHRAQACLFRAKVCLLCCIHRHLAAQPPPCSLPQVEHPAGPPCLMHTSNVTSMHRQSQHDFMCHLDDGAADRLQSTSQTCVRWQLPCCGWQHVCASQHRHRDHSSMCMLLSHPCCLSSVKSTQYAQPSREMTSSAHTCTATHHKCVAVRVPVMGWPAHGAEDAEPLLRRVKAEQNCVQTGLGHTGSVEIFWGVPHDS